MDGNKLNAPFTNPVLMYLERLINKEFTNLSEILDGYILEAK